jgi:hypothetical protein
MRLFRKVVAHLRKRRIAGTFRRWHETNVVRGEPHLTPLLALFQDYCAWCVTHGQVPMTGAEFAGAMGCSQSAFQLLGWTPMYIRGALRHA